AVLVSDCGPQLQQVRDAIDHVPIERLRELAALTSAQCELRRGKPQ
ncbi:MAG: hypothetical protein H0V17_34085, partial [Deltaproteobacteria bacterium]|nr:hypothetical protein [Deltaproteobacteria bacterium]